MEISHEEFNATIREKQKYDRMKENVRNVSEFSSIEKQENMRLNSVNSKKITKLQIIYNTGDFNCLKTCELKTRIELKKIKNYRVFCAIKKFYFIFCVYKIYLISAEGYKNAGVRFVRVRKIGEIWPSMKNVQHGVGVQNMQKTTKKFMSKMML